MIALLNGFDSLDGKIPDGLDTFWRSFWGNQWFKGLAQRRYHLATAGVRQPFTTAAVRGLRSGGPLSGGDLNGSTQHFVL